MDPKPSKPTRILLVIDTAADHCGVGCGWLARSGDLCHLFYKLLNRDDTGKPLRCTACHEAEMAAILAVY